ncbi:MAG: hypothetical protein B0W54_05995 [Cellvibrio sp. 79]|nr:MAG: hypothetical protein B0W54_05995 [Cellvibrio sp. 79]
MTNNSVLSPPAIRLWLAIRLPANVSHPSIDTSENGVEKKLMELCETLYQFTPHLQIYISGYTNANGVLLEISRSLTLFGGIQILLDAIHQQLQIQNISQHYHHALAHTAQAAWLCSFLDGQEQHVPYIEQKIMAHQPEQLRQFFREQLQPLPVTCLEEFPRAITALKQTGFVLLGDIIQQIQVSGLRSFTKRFGNEFSQYLSDMLDISQDLQQTGLFSAPVPIFHPEIPFIERVDFEFPVAQLDLLQPGMELLLQKLSNYLQQRQQQCQMVEWHLISIYQEREIIRVHCDTPQQQGNLLLDLSLIQLEQYAFRFAVDQLELHCPFTSSLQGQTYHLDFSQQSPNHKTTQDFTLTTAKLKARLGNSAIYKISYKDDHLPELTNDIISYHKTAWQALPVLQQQALRPKWLFAIPQTIEHTATGLQWRGHLQLLAGPERIHTHWWDTPTARDYFMAQRYDGLRLWIFKDLQQQRWFVQGVFC